MGGVGVRGEELNLGVWLAAILYSSSSFGRLNISRTRGAARTRRNRYPSFQVWLHVLSISPPVAIGFFKKLNFVSRKKKVSIFYLVDNFRARDMGEMMVVISPQRVKLELIFFRHLSGRRGKREGAPKPFPLWTHLSITSTLDFFLLCGCGDGDGAGVCVPKPEGVTGYPLSFSVNSSVPFQIWSFLLSPPPQRQSKRFGRKEFQFPTFLATGN